ncbi:GNAT family N-acetyltransferase [Halosegnis marinus]|uniref:GNAT family N-acetyltransferase n=1 Tax=Halosegnis marinus TaxID=3034023 RepID=A0ABD5ZP16_9EURY|nr:GNAT family protein [Halosegnis sp. DT85]
MPGPTFVDCDRIALRTVEAEDREFLRAAANHPDVRRYVARFDGPYSRERFDAELFEELLTDDYPILLACDGDDPLGCVSLAPIRDDDGWANLGAWLHPDHHGEGYATEACAYLLDYGFGERGLRRVSAAHMAPNDASAAVLDRLGFVHEGTRRRHVAADGGYVDREVYGLLCDEWDGAASVLG